MRDTSLFAAMSLLGLFATTALAQDTHRSPYAGFETRTIKALSSRQIEDLKTGRGMTLALAAELNGYPGPQHTLELAAELGLSEAQRARVGVLLDAMKAEAIALGEKLIPQEAALDALFARRSVSPESLAAAVRAAGELQTALRHTHLKYHLSTRDVLTPHQVHRYAELRGYSSGGHVPVPEHAKP